MAMAKRVFLFILTNVLIILTISITLSLLGVKGYATAQGINYEALLVFSAVVGFSGALISLLLSRWMAKMTMGVKLVDPRTVNPQERWLVDRVYEYSKRAGLKVMPEVGVYNSPEVNAFATGPSKSRSLVAVSSGLLQRMDESAVEGVLAHEVAHIANGDMVTMTLLQGVVNTFVVFLSRACAWAASQALSRGGDREEGGRNPLIEFAFIILFEIVFSILGSLVVFAYSRRREFYADAGAAALAGSHKMIHALESLKKSMNFVDDTQQSLATMKIAGKRRGGLMAMFITHPPLEDRIQALKVGAYKSPINQF